MKHTELPWTVSWSDHDNNGPIYFIENVRISTTTEEHNANAAFICHAVNNHYKLVEELRNARSELWDAWHSHITPDQEAMLKNIDAALTSATGGGDE